MSAEHSHREIGVWDGLSSLSGGVPGSHHRLDQQAGLPGRSARASEALTSLHRRMFAEPPQTTGIERAGDYEVRINDGPNFYILYKDIFVRRYYHFASRGKAPFILDGGGNIGMSVLYFKQVYPAARVVTFEPDTDVLPLLRENIARNGIENVEVVPAALSSGEGPATFHGDGKYGGCLAAGCEKGFTYQQERGFTHQHPASTGYEVPCVRLHGYLTAEVDFLKLNIEGAEWEVLADCGDRLAMVREMVIEYHHLPGMPRTLHRILELLDSAGFDYLINDFDRQTNPGVEAPFRLLPGDRYYLLVYARRRAD